MFFSLSQPLAERLSASRAASVGTFPCGFSICEISLPIDPFDGEADDVHGRSFSSNAMLYRTAAFSASDQRSCRSPQIHSPLIVSYTPQRAGLGSVIWRAS